MINIDPLFINPLPAPLHLLENPPECLHHPPQVPTVYSYYTNKLGGEPLIVLRILTIILSPVALYSHPFKQSTMVTRP